MTRQTVRRQRTAMAARARLTVLSLVALLVVFSAGSQAIAQDLGTIEPGKLTVAFNGDMPMTSLKDGQLVGTDGEMISQIAKDLGLQMAPQQMEWAAEIESTTSGRVDLMLGAMGWTEERSKVMLLTDPIYYFGTLLELKKVPGIGEASLYDTSDAVMRDLVAGRIDMAILDPPLVALAIKEHPEWDLHQVPLDPDPNFPIMSTKYNVVMGIRKDAQGLEDAVNKEIANLWATCANQAMMAKYGVTDASFFVPPYPNPRVGVDRPEGWKSPTLNPACDMNAAGNATATP
jgi:ABC-type amino acid transport substrate-binding protein